MNKILCPIDFSEVSLNAIEFAVEIAKKFSSRITLLHVFVEEDFNKAVGSAAASGKSFKELMGMANTKLKNLSTAINEDLGNKGIDTCDYYMEMGNLRNKVKEVAEDENYDLIIMGTTGVSKSNGVYFGSNTEDIIEFIQKPILCIPENARFTKFKKIIYSSDFLLEDRYAIQEVISFATMFDARIQVLHLNLKDSDEEYKSFVNELKSFIQYNKITFVNKNYKGDLGEAINEYVEAEKGDLHVVYKRKRGIVQSIFSKSLTRILSYTTNKPLLVLKL